MLRLNVDDIRRTIASSDGFQTVGRLHSARGLLSTTLPAAVGEFCRVALPGGRAALAEVIGLQQGLSQVLPYEDIAGMHAGTDVVGLGRSHEVPFGEELLGRVIDGLGSVQDGGPPIRPRRRVPVRGSAPPAMHRPRISRPFITGQRVIDGMLTIGHGQRVGLFAGSGVGKSTLLGEIARHAQCDANVIALLGERGREVRPFLDDNLGQAGLARTVVVVSSSEQPPLLRVRSTQAAVAIAAEFRRQGADVLFLLDSVTRLAMAQREIGLLLGEPPSARGYTPSVFQLLANLLEQLGTSPEGSITGIVTVLVDGDDLDEPITDAVRSIVDGHIVLDRKLAEKNHFPAVDVSRSLSRLFREVTDSAHQESAGKLRAMLATWQDVSDLIKVGAYTQGTSPQIDRAIDLMPVLDVFLKQSTGAYAAFDETRQALHRIAGAWPF